MVKNLNEDYNEEYDDYDAMFAYRELGREVDALKEALDQFDAEIHFNTVEDNDVSGVEMAYRDLKESILSFEAFVEQTYGVDVEI